MKNRCLNYNKLIIFLFTIFSGLFYSQNYENPDNWFLGMDYTNALSGISLQPERENYTIDLEQWLRRLYDTEASFRESWLISGANKQYEPREKILMKNDFDTDSQKFHRIKEKSVDDVSGYKLALQRFLLSTYNFDRKDITFNKLGNLSEVVLYKDLGSKIHSDMETVNFKLIREILNHIYGEGSVNLLKTEKILMYTWSSKHSTINWGADYQNEVFVLMYSVK